jgi:S-formylglutathione hydrolase FrmB
MRRLIWLGAVVLLPLFATRASAWIGYHNLERFNARLAGRVVDYTHNHGADRRIWSNVLHERRDLYVYLPPGFDPGCRYPVLLWLHGIDEDEKSLLAFGGLVVIDKAIACGRLPPLIVAMPDGSGPGRPTIYGLNPQWENNNAGPWLDYLLDDVWPFIQTHYPIRPEREAHVLGGFSGGGGAAFRIGIRYRQDWGVVLGIHPNVNVRWLDCHGHYHGPFDPDCWGWRTDFTHGHEVVGRFFGLITIRLGQLVFPLYGCGPDTAAKISNVNPIEMIDIDHLQPGELAMYIAYAGRDQFNITAQVDSFLFRARERGLEVGVVFDPKGKHSWFSGTPMLPEMLDWLAPLLAPYSPSSVISH